MRSAPLLAILAVLSSAHRALANDNDDDDDDDEPIAAATSTKLDRRELDHRPHIRTHELLSHVPGLYTLWVGAQAPQYLVRGYAAGQGADLGVVVDGVPINIGSHAFAHGYADTHFLIADAIESIALHEGAYASRFGSFSVAGTLDIKTLDALPKGGAVVRLSSGTELTAPLLASRVRRLRYKLVGLFSPELEQGSALLAAEVGIDDGPFVHPQRYRRGVVLGKWKRPLGDGELSTAIQFYSGRWFDSGFLARSAIASNHLSPFSASDPSQGGIAQRASASLSYEVTDTKQATWHLSAYVVSSDVRLYTNPTLYLQDTTNGDEIEYVDERVYYGLDAFYRRRHRVGPLHGRVRFGIQARADHADAATWHDVRRLRLVDCSPATNPCTDLAPATNQVSAYAEDHLRYSKHLRFYAGIRLDEESWNVDDRDADTMLGATSLGGTGSRARISPKAGILLSNAANDAQLSLLAGAGSHSTDARAAVDRSGFGAFIRTYNAELGAKLAPSSALTAAFAAWWSSVGENQVWDPATATTYRADDTTHYGLDARIRFTPTSWLASDASLSTARGTSTPDDATRPAELVPLAPRIMAHAGISLFRPTRFISLRVRAIGARATSDPTLTAEGHTIVDLIAAQRWRDFELAVTIDNLFDARWYEQQFASDVRTSRRVDAMRDVLVTPGVPLTALVTLGYSAR